MTHAPDSRTPSPAQGVRAADVLGGFSLASDLAAGLHPEHGARSCYIGMHLADTLGCAVAAEGRVNGQRADNWTDFGVAATRAAQRLG